MQTQYLFGGPGTGKTTALLDIVDQHLQAGLAPDRIGFFAFTRKAAQEAKVRARERFGLTDRDLPYFRTLHSLCYHMLGVQRGEILGKPDWKELEGLLGIKFGRPDPTEGPVTSGTSRGGAMLGLLGYAAARRMDLCDAWHEHGAGVPWHELVQLRETLRLYKHDTGRLDFDDLLRLYVAEGVPAPVQLAIVDEAQDLTPAQWEVVDRAVGDATWVVVAGDDDQAIYRWSGAAVGTFLQRAQRSEVRVLPVSHRLPAPVFQAAARVVGRLQQRQGKDWRPAAHDGSVGWAMQPQDVDLTTGQWLLLARNRWLLQPLEATCRAQGVAYTTPDGPAVLPAHVRAIVAWERMRQGKAVTGTQAQAVLDCVVGAKGRTDTERQYLLPDLQREHGLRDVRIWHDALDRISIEDREFYLTILRRGERLQDPPRVGVSTIHGAKGGEADNVVLCTDMTRRSHEGYRLAPDDEHRVFYTGMTRAKHRLVLLAPTTTRYYEP